MGGKIANEMINSFEKSDTGQKYVKEQYYKDGKKIGKATFSALGDFYDGMYKALQIMGYLFSNIFNASLGSEASDQT